ncbi:DUF4442 domain-containing protein [Halpernia frigidisoli]|uniref:Thioesterase n=1 Tax=Halpernia frigidisoli TaxID=1125876 RepID=A0A1I3DA32_9FLAO|nr:DUF4442 domain-containing protein [Halpernia frigidisoli]SFH83602.1 protein of unknown function [Halpernia frigidisoli]
MTKLQFHLYLLAKIPISYLAGVRLESLKKEECQTKVKLSWFSQNPFNSMFWAVQGMAAEFSTGIMCAEKIRKSKQKISMLVTEQDAEFTKKATGKIIFKCNQGRDIDNAIQQAIETGEGVELMLFSTGINEMGEIVSKFSFKWSFKVKN